MTFDLERHLAMLRSGELRSWLARDGTKLERCVAGRGYCGPRDASCPQGVPMTPAEAQELQDEAGSSP